MTSRSNRYWHVLVIAAASVVSLLSAHDFAGGWNDSSRLATVESLVDRHTWAIDDSKFCPATQDKLLIDGHFYSDKSPVPALLMAGEYTVAQALLRLTIADRPQLFCWILTLATSGLAYVAAVWSMFRLGRPLRLSIGLRLGITASFAFATIALPYLRHINNHTLLLGVATPLMVELVWLSTAGSTPTRLLTIGSLAGFAYTIDLGAGPVLLLGAGLHALFRSGTRCALLVGAAALPWLALHHGLNYAIGGTWMPANAVPEYLSWPGSPFDAHSMTGGWNHPGVGSFLLYAIDLLVGKRGFLGHDLALYLAVPAAVLMLTKRRQERPEVLLAVGWFVGVWLLYAATSTNYSGACCSVRWYVPLLAPGYFVLALFLRERPEFRIDFIVLSLWGGAMAALMWWKGPWMLRMVPYYWVFVGGAAMSWSAIRIRAWRTTAATSSLAEIPRRAAA